MFNSANDPNIRYFYPVKPSKCIWYIDNERTLTDRIWVGFYASLTLIILIAFFYSFILENEQNLLKPKDSSGNKCG